MVLGQLHTGLDNGIVAQHPAGEPVVDQPAPLGFTIGQYAQQDQGAELGKFDLRIIQRLGRILDRLAVDPLAGIGVVLHLDGQIPAQGLHEQGVQDVQVRMTAIDRHPAPGPGPLEIKRRRQHDVALAARIQVLQPAIGSQRPTEHAHIGAALADLEGGQQAPAAHGSAATAAAGSRRTGR